jgi:hypothetical protein
LAVLSLGPIPDVVTVNLQEASFESSPDETLTEEPVE